ncbi:hypothetical protein OAM96_01135 [Candidatus Poseidoniaceae archaeon]|jgi:hypothetical protein|nr:hypothetical protein [Candidatus Poseidoniaceae archaeon]
MAWPFSGGDGDSQDADALLSEERLKIMANVAIEQVPLPEEGELSEEDAWTISPGPTKARLNSIGSVPSVAASLAPAQPVNMNAQVDTSSLERLISSRLDMVEDVLRLVEYKLDEGPITQDGSQSEDASDDESMEIDANSGDVIITSSGEVIAATGVDRMMDEDDAPLVELYEAQALRANPFLVAPSDGLGGGTNQIGAPTVSALLLDNMSGMAAVSFTQKAIDSGMLTVDEGETVMAIVQLAAPGESEAALEDHLANKELLTLSALVKSWRSSEGLRGEL